MNKPKTGLSFRKNGEVLNMGINCRSFALTALSTISQKFPETTEKVSDLMQRVSTLPEEVWLNLDVFRWREPRGNHTHGYRVKVDDEAIELAKNNLLRKDGV